MANEALDLMEEFFSDPYLENSSSEIDLGLGILGSGYATEATTNLDDPFLFSPSHDNSVLDILDPSQEMFDLPIQPDISIGNCGTVKSSPWHESDSGVSDTLSVLGSPEHSMSDFRNSDKSHSGDRRMHSPIDEELDNELAAYLQSDEGEMHSPTAQSVSDSEDLTFFTRSLDKEALLDFGDDFLGGNGGTWKNKSKRISGNDHDKCNVKTAALSGPSEVKILKVVRPSNASAGVTSEDIAQAMEERSKKNAAQAKLNREKKKAYIQSLESEVVELKSSNEELSAENAKMKQEVADKDEEINYLKSVLANSSALSNLLKNITDVKEVKLSAAIMTRKRAANGDHSYNLVENAPQKRARLIDENLKKAGVCLHVTGGTACLEFCAHCSKLAQKTYSYS